MHIDLTNHTKCHEEKTQVNIALIKCDLSEKTLKSKMDLDQHNETYHNIEINTQNIPIHEAVLDEDMVIRKNCAETNTSINVNFNESNNISKNKTKNFKRVHDYNNSFKLQYLKLIGLVPNPKSLQTRNQSKMKCQKCNHKFGKIEDLSRHIKHCKKIPDEQNIVNKSVIKTPTYNHSIENQLCLRSTKNKKIEMCEASQSNRSADTGLIPTQHKKSNTLKVETFSCGYCMKTFIKKHSWINHLRWKHQVNPNSVSPDHHVKSSNYSKRSHQIKKMTDCNDLSNTISVNTKNKLKHSCNICQKQFTYFYALSNHMYNHSGINKPYQCQYCSKAFNTKGCLTNHEKTHSLHNKKKKQFIDGNASGTNLRTKSGVLCNQNISSQSQKTAKPFVCGLCQKSFVSKQYLNMHSKIHYWQHAHNSSFLKNRLTNKSKSVKKFCHSSKSESTLPNSTLSLANKNYLKTKPTHFNCTFCHKTYCSESNRNKHIKLYHSDISNSTNLCTSDTNGFYCKLCDKSYSNKGNLARHNKQRHLCNASIKLRSTRYHQEHSNLKNIVLNENKVNTNENTNTYQQHIKQKRATSEYSCKFCKMKFPSISTLQAHSKAQHMLNEYKCEDCDEQFPTNYNLGVHILAIHNIPNTEK